jgi:hypothetical protein
LRTLLLFALAVTLIGCSHQPPNQAVADACADQRGFACLHRSPAHQPIERASLKTNPLKEAKLRGKTSPPVQVPDKAVHVVARKARPVRVAAEPKLSATRIPLPPLPPPSSDAQLKPKTSVASADPDTIGQSTVGLVSNAKSSAIKQQVATATAVAERMTAALAVERDDVEPVDGSSPGTTTPMVAIVMARPEIGSVTDLAYQDVAIDRSYSASSVDVRIAFVLAGARSVELSADDTKAIDRLVNGKVPAAVLTVVSADSAEGFPDIAGFKIFRIPLMQRPSKPRP